MTKLYEYELVYNYLLGLIQNECYEHDKIPSESMLCQKFNLSRLTVRQGINKLKNEGYLYSRRGSGTFVSPSKITYRISPETTFSDEIKKAGKNSAIKFIEKKIIKADEIVASKLSVKEGEQVLYVKNIRLVDDVPFLYAEYYINLPVLKNIYNIIMDISSFSKMYKEQYGLDPIRDNSEINITSTNYHSKELFNIQNDLPLIKISTTTIDKKTKQILDFCDSYFRSDLAKIVIKYKDL